ncbi:protein-disulfide isomerase [Nitrosopumilus sp. b1]|uniref:protein-disulfide isomerase n=1 Tax=Nitrosopumilus sp. b1 TaxID=2109907 RepID=UPI0015F4BD90|nr:protein-disulfide isomerase [Nitrosopumilus sp. b1]KAF6242070.1 protein-disulfide isomerase [Nitrosopumilus sp. b1]
MGKKKRREREEKRDSYASQQGKKKRKNVLIASGVLLGIAAIVGISAYNFATMQTNVPGAPPGAGMLGDEHEHASILVRIFGDKFDFSGPAFQIKSSWIHFEAQDGTTIHRHSSGVTTGYLFETLGITVDDQCYIFPDGRQFCTNEDYTLKYYVNHEQVSDISEYVFEDGDRILITYGNETPEEIEEYLAELDAQPIVA